MKEHHVMTEGEQKCSKESKLWPVDRVEFVSDVRVRARSLPCPQNDRALHVVEQGGASIARVQATCLMVVLRAPPVTD